MLQALPLKLFLAMPEQLASGSRCTLLSLIEAVSCPLEATPWDTPDVEGKGS
jgi:hypothetical protein